MPRPRVAQAVERVERHRDGDRADDLPLRTIGTASSRNRPGASPNTSVLRSMACRPTSSGSRRSPEAVVANRKGCPFSSVMTEMAFSSGAVSTNS